MSFNRLGYDTCAYAKTLQQSVDPLDYHLFKGKYESCTQCKISDYTNNLEFGIKTDVESDLKGQTRKGSKCPTEKFPAFSQSGAEYSPPITCTSIYNITPNNIQKITTSGLRDLSSYGQNVCPIKK
jgi:hypothetical protein